MLFLSSAQPAIDTAKLVQRAETLEAALPLRQYKPRSNSADSKLSDRRAFLQTRTKEAHAMPSRAAEFRKRAADALRNGRNARLASDRDSHFDTAASYKALALEEEWMRGDRQRSVSRKNK
jgi:hypothetical protein